MRENDKKICEGDKKTLIASILVPNIISATKEALNISKIDDIKNRKVYLGVSGGLDSISLFVAWNYIKENLNISFTVIHVEHGIRGKESLEDKKFVENLCLDKNIDFQYRHINVPDVFKKQKGGLEEIARDLRYDAFENIMKKESILYLGHHMDDQIETILLNIFRGSGLNGLVGIKKYRQLRDKIVIRPFINIKKTTLRLALIEANQKWREDKSNYEDISKRNTLRNSTLPLLNKEYPYLERSISRLSKIVKAEEEFWEIYLTKWFSQYGYFSYEKNQIKREIFDGESMASKRRIIRQFYKNTILACRLTLKKDMASLSFEQTEECIKFIADKSTKKINIAQNMFMEKSDKYIYLSPDRSVTNDKIMNDKIKLTNFNSKNFEFTFKDWIFKFKPIEIKNLACFGNQKTFQILNLSSYTDLSMRTRQNGDWISLGEGKGRKSLNKFFIDKKIDNPLRDIWPLLTSKNEILWIPGLYVSKKIYVSKLDSDGTHIEYTLPGFI